MRATTLAAVGLVAGGIALAVVGWRMREAELTSARHHQVEVAQSDANGAAADVVGMVRGEGVAALRDPRWPERSKAVDVHEPAGKTIEIPEAERLLMEEADFRLRARDDAEGALAIERRIAERAPRTDPTGEFVRLCALRVGVLEARTGLVDDARRDLAVAATAGPWPWDPTNRAHVRAQALYALARLDLAAGREGGVSAFLEGPGSDLDVARGESYVLPADLVLALEAEARSAPALPDAIAKSLAEAARRARRVLAWRDRMAIAPVVVADGEIGIRLGTSFGGVPLGPPPPFFSIAPVSELDHLTNWGRGRVSRLQVVPAGTGSGLARARLAAPLDALEVVASINEPPSAGAFGAWALVAAILVYALGAAFTWASIRRAQGTAAMQADFVASVSHDMKTPIAAVQAMAEMLGDGRVPGRDREREYAQRIEAEMRRLGTTVRNVLDAAKIERGMDGILRPRPTEPGAVVTNLVESVRPSLEARGFRVGLEVAPSEKPLAIDPDALTSVVANLVDNAAKFSREKKEIDVRAVPGTSGGYLVEVLDRGPGVPAADREHVFERFWRGAGAKEDAVPGVGLGLHVARSLVEAHGGTLRVSDREGGGARFVVSLPAPYRNGRAA